MNYNTFCTDVQLYLSDVFRADKSESISTDNIHVAIEGLTCSMSQYNLRVAVREPPSLQCVKVFAMGT